MNESLISKIRQQFAKEEAKLLLVNDHVDPHDYWYNINRTSTIASTGFCYLACEVYYQLEGKSQEWWFKEIHSDKLPFNGCHFFLQNKFSGEIVDITGDQFSDLVPPYSESKNKGIRFMSKNCRKFIELMNDNVFDFYEHPVEGWMQGSNIHDVFYGSWQKCMFGKHAFIMLGDETKQFNLVVGNVSLGGFKTPEKAAEFASTLVE